VFHGDLQLLAGRSAVCHYRNSTDVTRFDATVNSLTFSTAKVEVEFCFQRLCEYFFSILVLHWFSNMIVLHYE